MLDPSYQPLKPITAALAGERCCAVTADCAAAPQGSRRRRLWELEANVHCPVVGACLPMPVLRRLVDKVLGGQAVAEDYEMHCGAIAECRSRSPLAEALHKELDRRYAVALRQSALAKTPEALEAWWHQAVQTDLAGAFWATLTHARCSAPLQHKVLGEVHMLQHQVGAAQRLDRAQFDTLVDENATLKRELAALQQRHQQHAMEQARELERAHAEVASLQARKVGQDASILLLRDRLAELEAAAPGLGSRMDLAQQNQLQAQRMAELELRLRLAERDTARQRQRADAALQTVREAGAEPIVVDSAPVTLLDDGAPVPAKLGDRAVLCVGGRPASVPLYRHIIERTGGRFLHHDGGEEESVARLEATLSAADLVICQTGCISHDAYWRVKTHCKRTGKQCVFVENPGGASLKRALAQLQTA